MKQAIQEATARVKARIDSASKAGKEKRAKLIADHRRHADRVKELLNGGKNGKGHKQNLHSLLSK